MCPRVLLTAGIVLALPLALRIANGASGSPGDALSPWSGATASSTILSSRFTLSTREFDDIAIAEVSGLAWDADQNRLYAVSDRGLLYHFAVSLEGKSVVAIEPLFATALQASVSDGEPFNAEGLAVRHADNGVQGDSELIVALEGDIPQIARFSPSGILLGTLPVPPPADDIAAYRKKGRGLESVALHPDFGLLTAPESPLKSQSAESHAIYADGHDWVISRFATESRLKGIDVLADGNLLVLERSRPGAGNTQQVASLRRVDLASCSVDGVCRTTLLVTLAAGPENFEGMTLLDPNHVLIASDDGGDADQATTFQLILLP